MGRFCVLLWGIVVSASLMGGCGAPPKGNWFARSASRGTKTVRSAEKTAVRNPIQPTGLDSTGGVKGSTNTMPVAGPDRERAIDHDSETMRFIAQELSDATPEEREEWYQNLRQLDPYWVRQTLRSRRLMIKMRQRAQQRQQIAGGSAPNVNGVVAVSGVQNPSAMNGAAGFGRPAGSPWGPSPFSDPAQRTVAYRSGPAAEWNQPNAPLSRDQMGRAGYPLNRANGWQNSVSGFAPNDRGTLGNRATQDPRFQQAARSAFNTPAANGTGGFGHRAPGAQNVATGGSNPVQLGPGRLRSAPWSGASTTPLQNNPYSATVPNQEPPPVASSSWGMQPRSLPATPADGFHENSPATRQAGPMHAPPPTGSPGKWDGELQKLILLAEAETAKLSPGTTEVEKEAYIQGHVYLRWLYLIAGRQAKALEAIPGLEPADQEFWQQMFWAVANYFDSDAMPDDAERASQTITQLHSAIGRLQENAKLELRNITFCHKISSFGNYERFDRDEFSPGQPVLIYAEVANFKSEPTADGQYRTLLRSTIEIYKAGPGGGLVKREEFRATEDLCRNHRKDYFHSYQIDIPQRITLGPHVLKLIVEDQLSRKVATYSLKFTVK